VQAVVDYFVVSDLVALDRGPMTATPMPGATRTMQETLLGYAPSARPDEARPRAHWVMCTVRRRRFSCCMAMRTR